MSILRFFLFPFGIIYWLITFIRNECYNLKVFSVFSFDIPIICVGNLNTGGTGKSPHVEYLIKLLSNNYKIAVLSRGYKRKSKGFLIANSISTTSDIGDEPLQFYKKFPNIIVAVDENRARGIKNLLNLNNAPTLIILDDAFQHRAVRAKVSILLSEVTKPFYKDYILPIGNLRESRSSYKRADIIVFTKATDSDVVQHSEDHKNILKARKNLFYSKISYNSLFPLNNNILIDDSNSMQYQVLLVCGIANPNPLINFCKTKYFQITPLIFPDHHDFTLSNVNYIKQQFSMLQKQDKILITTEKDAMRLSEFFFNELKDVPCFYQSITIKFIEYKNSESFDNCISNLI